MSSKLNKDEIEVAVIELVKRVIPRTMRDKEITLELNLKNDLYIDSLGLAELLILIDKQLGIDFFGKNINLLTVKSIVDEIIKLQK